MLIVVFEACLSYDTNTQTWSNTMSSMCFSFHHLCLPITELNKYIRNGGEGTWNAVCQQGGPTHLSSSASHALPFSTDHTPNPFSHPGGFHFSLMDGPFSTVGSNNGSHQNHMSTTLT